MLAGVSLLAGCATAHRTTVSERAVAVTNRAPIGPKPESPEVADRRAEAHARFLSAASLELNEESSEAELEYEKALLGDPGNEQLALDLSRRFIQRKEYERAATLLKKVCASPEATAATFSRLAFVYLQQGRTNLVVEVNQAAIKRQPDSIAGYQSLYSFYRQNGQTNEARRVLDQAARQPRPDAPFLVDLAMLHLLEDTPKRNSTNILVSARARDALKRAAAMSPTNFVVLQKLAQGLRLTGETKKASEVYQKLLEQFPGVPGAREDLADMLLRSNDTQGAAEQLEAIIRDNPTNPQAYYLLGAIAYESQKYAEAVDHYRKALLLNPAFEQVYYDIAAAKIALNEALDALDYLRQAEKRFKPSFIGEFFSGVAFVRLKEFTNAVQHFTAAEIVAKAADSNRLTPTFYFQFGTACERAGRIAEAESHFDKALQLSPDFAEALNYLGYMWADRGTNLDRARRMIERAVSLQPTNAAYLDSLGWVLFKQGHLKEALPRIEKAVKLNQEPDATLYDHLGDILAALQQPEKARDAWKKSLDIEPNKDIEQKLQNSASGGKPKR